MHRRLAAIVVVGVLLASAVGAGAMAAGTPSVAVQDDGARNDTAGNDAAGNESAGNDTAPNESAAEDASPLEDDDSPIDRPESSGDAGGADDVGGADDAGEAADAAPGEEGPAPPAVAPPSQSASNQTTVTVSGVGEASAEPDRAIVYVAASATGDSASEATEALAANTSSLQQVLEGSNLTGTVYTTDYRVYQQRDANGTETWIARHAFAAGATDPDAAGDVIDLAVEAGATEVGGIEFTLSEERTRTVRATAIDRAVADANDQAVAVANSTGLELGEIRSVSVGDGGVGPVFVEASDVSTSIDVGDVTVTARVEITYRADG